MEKLEIFLLTMITLSLFSLGFISSKIIDQNEFIFKDIERSMTVTLVPNSEQEIINTCQNLSLKQSAECLRNEIRIFYNYTLTDDDIAKKMTLDEIKRLGGDCGTYAYLYERLAKGLGFNSTTNNYYGLADVYAGHRWAIMWDYEEGIFCELDQLGVKCQEIKNED